MSFIFRHRCLLFALPLAVSLGGLGAAMPMNGEVIVSQKSKQFQPSMIEIGTNQPLVIVNDDGGTVHHAYVESDTFNFDSGDQNPGTRTTIVFPGKGDYQVLCGIHPKMKLSVRVR